MERETPGNERTPGPMTQTWAEGAHRDTAAALGPVREGERILGLDVLRGVALFGILVVNVAYFALPLAHADGDPAFAQAPAADQFAKGVVRVLFAQKFVSLFSLLFGIGLIVQRDRAAASARPFAPLYLRRLVVLLAFGLVHGFALWYGDILAVYAFAGAILLPCAGLKPRTLLVLAGVSLIVSTAALTGLTALEAAFSGALDAAAAPATDARGFDAIWQAQFNPDLWREAETAAYRHGPLGDALAFRALSYVLAFLSAFFGWFWHILAMFLLGAALMKSGFFEPRNAHWHRRFLIVGLAVGLPAEIAGGLSEHAAGYRTTLWTALLVPVHSVGSVALMLGYVGAITLVVHRASAGWLVRALARVGRMGLTNYLLQTVLCTFVTYWWGLARFGELTRPQLLALACVVYGVQIALSAVWLRFFTMGPAEWLWRRLTYLRAPLPLRRSPAPR